VATTPLHPDIVTAQRYIHESACLVQKHYGDAPEKMVEAFDHLEDAHRILHSTFAEAPMNE
jgi:hypothetical protein